MGDVSSYRAGSISSRLNRNSVVIQSRMTNCQMHSTPKASGSKTQRLEEDGRTLWSFFKPLYPVSLRNFRVCKGTRLSREVMAYPHDDPEESLQRSLTPDTFIVEGTERRPCLAVSLHITTVSAALMSSNFVQV